MQKVENISEGFTIRFLQTLNRHLPEKRKTLKELLAEERPVIKNRDGTTHFFDKKELEKLALILLEPEHRSLRLPINLEMSSSMERGTVKVSGRLECRVISRILNENKEPDESIDSAVIYYPHLPKIRKELYTTTQFMFTL